MNQQNLYFLQRGEGSICDNMDMMGPGLSRKDIRILTTQIFNAKATTKIATWNVRTMHQCCKTQQVINEMKSYKLDILGISEMRWTGNGRTTSEGSTILFSGNQNSHNRGMGILLHDITTKTLIGWKPLNDRIITARLLTRHAKVTVIQVYAPSNVSTSDEKLELYNHRQETLDEIPHHDIKLLIGSNRGLECTIGQHSSGNTTTDNGELLIQFCSFNGLCIGNTILNTRTYTKKRGRHLMEQPTMKLITFVSVAIGDHQYKMFAFFQEPVVEVTTHYWVGKFA